MKYKENETKTILKPTSPNIKKSLNLFDTGNKVFYQKDGGKKRV